MGGVKYLFTVSCVTALLLVLLVPSVKADRVSDLEARMIQLEKENAELRSMLMEVMGDVKEQKAAAPAAPAGIPMEKPYLGGFLKDTQIGGDFRLRGVALGHFWNFDTAGYDDSWEFYRMRTRLWINTQVTDDLRFYFRAANEFRWGDDDVEGTLGTNLDQAIGRKDLVVDNAYLEWAKPFGVEPLTLKIGRQDLIYGEGFMILDDQDNVGSFLIGFDGIKSSWELGEKTNLDAFAMKIQENDLSGADDEDFYGLYLTDTSAFEDHKIEAYVLYRNQNGADILGAGAVLPSQWTTAIGGRLSGGFIDNKLTYALEGNYQFGELDEVTGDYFASYTPGEDLDRRAYGGYIWGKYTFTDTQMQPYIKLQGVFTSGDDPDSSDYEGFDTFYGEWPKFSEGMIYQLYDPFHPLKGGTDPDMGAWTNMIIARAEAGFNPIEKGNLMVAYQHLWADEETSGTGDEDRGHMAQSVFTYNFNKNLSTHLVGEYFWPEDYYPDDADDAFFGRWQMLLKF